MSNNNICLIYKINERNKSKHDHICNLFFLNNNFLLSFCYFIFFMIFVSDLRCILIKTLTVQMDFKKT